MAGGITRRQLRSRGFVHITVTESGPVPRKIRKQHNRISKQTWRDAAKLHHKEHIPKRFTEEGARELGFRKRTSKYEARKQKVYGHNDPNVWSGKSRRDAKSYRPSGTSKYVRMRYNAPTLNFGSGNKELRSASKTEADTIAEFWALRYQSEMAKI